jgi:NAD(P)H-nitrite reductase large subunit
LEKAAIYQNNGRYGIAPHIPGGLVTPAQLRMLADIAEKYRVDAIKITSAQRIALIGIDEKDLDAAWADLNTKPGMAIGMCVRSVKFCPGNRFCPYGQQDTIAMGLRLDDMFYARKLPHKFKIGVSGCPMQCAETCIKDFGLYGMKTGWRALAGGNGGPAPRLSKPIADKLSDDQAVELAQKVIDVYEQEGFNGRIGKWIEQIGAEEFKRKLGLESAQDMKAPS